MTDHPTDGLKKDLHYIFHYIGCMADGDIDNLNLSTDEMETLVLRQLNDGKPVWFGCDSGAFGDRAMGIWDPDSMGIGEFGEMDYVDISGEVVTFQG